MTETVIWENEYVTLKFHEDTKIVHHECHQYLFGDRFRECLTRGVATLEKYGAKKWLSDDRKTSALPPDDANWSEVEWAPDAFEKGWRYWAIVLPERAIGKMAVDRIIGDPGINAQLRIQVFSDPNAAYEWLAHQ